MSDTLRVGLAGLGTVGSGVLRLLAENESIIAARAGRQVRPVAVSARNRNRDRGTSIEHLRWLDDPLDLVRDPEIDVVVELIGGADGPAKALVEAAIEAGKPVVSANKAMLAEHGVGLAARAEAAGTPLRFEAAVAGGIPVIKTLREGLAANRIASLAGILNGTCNYILTTMFAERREFDEVLADAQALGYAEADPSFDIDGIDAAHKLAILAAIAFGRQVDLGAVHVEGIRRISMLDISFAEELGYRIKLLGIARASTNGIETRVHPAMIPANAPLAHVEGVFNAIVAEAEPVGRLVLQGRGAGGGPTASAVVADLIDVARGRSAPMLGVATDWLATLPSLPMSAHRGAYYLRLTVLDRPGVIADVAAILRDQAISLESLLQHGRSQDEAVPVVLVTHVTQEAAMRAALDRIEALDAVIEPPVLVRIEPQ